jgi:hypothetical protein
MADEELEIMLWKRARSGTKSPITAAIASYAGTGVRVGSEAVDVVWRWRCRSRWRWRCSFCLGLGGGARMRCDGFGREGKAQKRRKEVLKQMTGN